MKPLTFGSLFAGIGGFDLGFERAGMVCKWQVEIDSYCQKVLAKHWPHVRRHDDVRTFPPSNPEEWHVDVICGGFPCQDISTANAKSKGIAGERSGLWKEYIRIIRALRPQFVAIENVSALLARGLHIVLGDLAQSGFDAEWQTLPASAFGAPHRRDRVLILAYPKRKRFKANEVFRRGASQAIREKQASRSRHWPGRCEPCPSLPDRLRWIPDRPIRDVVDGIPGELDAYRVFGNAVVPQVAEWIGRRIVEAVGAA